MGNLAYLRYRDRANVVLSVSSEDVLYPKENLDALPVAQPFRTGLGDVASQYIDVDLGAAASVSVLALVGHNLSADATIQLNGGTAASPDGSIFNVTVSPRERTAWRKFAAQVYRYWRIAIHDPANTDGYLSIGLLLLGAATTLSVGYVHEGWAWDDESNTREFQSGLGVPQVGDTLYDLSRLQIEFSNVNRTEAAELRNWLVGLHGRKEPLLVIPSPDYQTEALFGRLSSVVRRQGVGNTGAFYSFTSLVFTEDHPGESIREPLFIAPDEDLNEWDAGNALSIFTRTGAAAYKDASLVLQSAAEDVARQLHYHTASEAGLLIEPAGQNDWTYSEDMTQGVWSKSEATISADAETAPDGQATADKVVESSNNAVHTVYRTVTAASITNDTKQAISLFAKAGERTKFRLFITQKDAGSSYFDVDLGAETIGTVTGDAVPVLDTEWSNGWKRLLVSIDSANGATDMQVEIRLLDGAGAESYTGDGSSGLYVWGLQFEIDRPWPTSYMVSGASNGTRGAEIAYLTAAFGPQPVTIYARWIELGQIETGADAELAPVMMGDPSGTHFTIRQTGALAAHHDNGVSTESDSIADAGAHGDTIEALASIDGTGAVMIHRKVNGGAAVDGAGSSALALPANWGAPGPLRFGVSLAGLVAPILLQRVALGRGVLDWADLDS